tara:strand:+ start:300 stop:572 length:273 start_codon:yes stop_codon:yes gene_type:complete
MLLYPAPVTKVSTVKSPVVSVVTVLTVDASANVIELPSITSLTLVAILTPEGLSADTVTDVATFDPAYVYDVLAGTSVIVTGNVGVNKLR